MKNKCKLISIIALSWLIASCSTSNQIYYKDGSHAEIIECEGPSWSACLKEAGLKCTESGYNVLEKNSGKKNGFFTNSDFRELIISCKQVQPTKSNTEKNPDPQEKSAQQPKSEPNESVDSSKYDVAPVTPDDKAVILDEKEGSTQIKSNSPIEKSTEGKN